MIVFALIHIIDRLLVSVICSSNYASVPQRSSKIRNHDAIQDMSLSPQPQPPRASCVWALSQNPGRPKLSPAGNVESPLCPTVNVIRCLSGPLLTAWPSPIVWGPTRTRTHTHAHAHAQPYASGLNTGAVPDAAHTAYPKLGSPLMGLPLMWTPEVKWVSASDTLW